MGEGHKPPIPLGTVVKPWGEIQAIVWSGGERHYLMVDKHGVVSHMPDDAVRAALEPGEG